MGLSWQRCPQRHINSKSKKTDDILLIIPFAGRSKIETAHASYTWQASDVALLLPGGTYSGVSTQSSILIINIDPVRLGLSADNIQSCDNKVDWQNELSSVRKIKIHLHNLSIDRIFQQLCAVIDQMADYPEFLGKSGLEESFYRAIALAIYPMLLGKEPEETKTQNYARRKVDSVCQYVKAHIAYDFTLADLDRISGMSRRSLHYEFQKRYLCAPMKWVRSERLRQAHDKLSRSLPSTTVTSLAISCGFSSPTVFANHYKKQYGEHPGNA
jgi:AraC-like DNA-binding protein